jgi:hypothetical protein
VIADEAITHSTPPDRPLMDLVPAGKKGHDRTFARGGLTSVLPSFAV